MPSRRDKPLPPLSEYDIRALELGQLADEKFKGQKLRRMVKKSAVFGVELFIAWVVVTVWLWLGVTMFLTKFNALDHLANIRLLDWAEMGAFATVFIYVVVRTFRFALED